MSGNHLDIAQLDTALRVSHNNSSSKEDNDNDKPVHVQLQVPAVGGSNPQYIAPEVFSNSNNNGFPRHDPLAFDLWAAGIMLYSMVVSSSALFVAPIPEDPLFVELCINGNITKQAAKYATNTKQEINLSDDLIDLLQKMMKVDPMERLSLAEVVEHPWVKDGQEEVPPPNILHPALA
jgi:serine/threonine protein kinase